MVKETVPACHTRTNLVGSCTLSKLELPFTIIYVWNLH